MKKPQKWQVVFILLLGVVSVSSAAIFVRLAMAAGEGGGVDFSLFLAASRLLVSALVILPLWKNIAKVKVNFKAYWYAVGAGISLAVHFAVWISSLSFTSIAASTTLVTTNPIWVAILSWWLLKEKPSKLTIAGISIAILGSIVIAFGDRAATAAYSNPLLGNLLALTGSIFVSCYLLFGRLAQQNGLKIDIYAAIAYTTAAIVLFPFPILFGSGYLSYETPVYFYVFLMAVVSQLIGHTSFNWSLAVISPTLVALALLFEPICASFFGFLLFAEVPSLLVLLGGAIQLLGVGFAVIGDRRLT